MNIIRRNGRVLQFDNFTAAANDVCSMSANGYFHVLLGD
jgi:hypothetical protein